MQRLQVRQPATASTAAVAVESWAGSRPSWAWPLPRRWEWRLCPAAAATALQSPCPTRRARGMAAGKRRARSSRPSRHRAPPFPLKTTLSGCSCDGAGRSFGRRRGGGRSRGFDHGCGTPAPVSAGGERVVPVRCRPLWSAVLRGRWRRHHDGGGCGKRAMRYGGGVRTHGRCGRLPGDLLHMGVVWPALASGAGRAVSVAARANVHSSFCCWWIFASLAGRPLPTGSVSPSRSVHAALGGRSMPWPRRRASVPVLPLSLGTASCIVLGPRQRCTAVVGPHDDDGCLLRYCRSRRSLGTTSAIPAGAT
ncbi:hypothetical protein I4F81_006533 [Pyropia yezoensis]|uniref:Uncharacterized protein n=1 Tax=Pyropia yezoensis TaxID=2788 RepID=A0ACC3C1Z4_PYRYE|nr:hypothetical protein I4F81_006533 [Neopyropia yezoensis]